MAPTDPDSTNGGVRSSVRVLACALLAAGLTVMASPAAQASTRRHVSTTGADTSCGQATAFLTIQFAIDCSSNGDIIFIAAGTYAQNLTIPVELKLIGAGAGSTILEPTPGAGGSVVYIPGAYGYRLHETINGVTITGGAADLFGGGIYNGQDFTRFSSLILTDSVVTGNAAAAQGGGIFNESGSALDLINTRVTRNTAADGGGLYNDGGGCFHSNSKIASNVPNDIVGC
jgi:hypothetical protein